MPYRVGDKVIMQVNQELYPTMSKINGHVCTVEELLIEDEIEMGHAYRLAWLPEDNPGKINEMHMPSISWYEAELRPYYNVPKYNQIKSKVLPDM